MTKERKPRPWPVLVVWDGYPMHFDASGEYFVVANDQRPVTAFPTKRLATAAVRRSVQYYTALHGKPDYPGAYHFYKVAL